MRFKAICLFAAIPWLFTTATAASASPVSGYWLTQDGAVVVGIDRCGSEDDIVCGLMVSFPGASSDPELAAAVNALCHQPIFWDLRKAGPHVWKNGKIFDPETERTYEVRLELDGARLRVRVSTAFPGLGETLVWHRFNGRVNDCRTARNAE